MPNGRNAGRLFADCTNEHGHGEWHRVETLDGANPGDAKTGRVRCVHCQREFDLTPDETMQGGRRLVPVETNPDKEMTYGPTEL